MKSPLARADVLYVMPSTYLPSREAELDAWLLNFSALVAADPASYGLTTGDAVAIKNAVDAWHAAHVVATCPETRTGPTVMVKNQARVAVLKVVRLHAATIRADSLISRVLKMGLGLHVPAISPASSPIPAPSTAPTLAVLGMRPGMQSLVAADSASPTRRARPRGTVGLLLFRAVADAPVRDPDDCRFYSFVTRAEFSSSFDHADHGKTATYFARWTNHKGELGPWSRAAVMPIAA